jgi:amidase
LVGSDAADSVTLAGEGKRLTDYTPFLKIDGLRGKRLGVLKRSMGFHGKTDSLFRQALRDIQAQGAELVDLDFTIGNDVGQASFQVLLYEFKAGREAWGVTPSWKAFNFLKWAKLWPLSAN